MRLILAVNYHSLVAAFFFGAIAGRALRLLLNQFYSALLLGPFALCMSSSRRCSCSARARVLKQSGAPGFAASSSLIAHLAGLRKPPSPLFILPSPTSGFPAVAAQPSSALLALFSSSWICSILDRAFFSSSSHSLIPLSTSLLDQSSVLSLILDTRFRLICPLEPDQSEWPPRHRVLAHTHSSSTNQRRQLADECAAVLVYDIFCFFLLPTLAHHAFGKGTVLRSGATDVR